jgi:ATP-dependent helicase/nuclease subunit A
LPYTAVRLGGLVSRLEVRDFAALARFLVMPHDSLALAHVLRSPLFGVSDDDLVALARATQAAAVPDELRPNWWQVLRQWHAAPLALAQATPQLARWIGWADTVPPHDLLSRVVSECGAHERYRQAAPAHLAAQAASNIDALLELALDIHGGEAPALITLANELEALAALPEQEAPAEGEAIYGQDQVRIMTIHAAKGLEAPIVILADAHRPAPRQSHDHAVVVWPMGATAPTHFSWAIADTALGAKRQSWVDAARVRESIEESNLLYVAVTRAAQFLIVSGHARAGADKDGHSSWYRAIERVVPAMPQMPTLLSAQASATVTRVALPIASEREVAVTRRNVGKRRQAPTASEAFGIAFHAWMDRLTRTASLERQGLLAECADDELARALAATLAHPLAAPFFDADNIIEARNEVELVAADGEILRPDRLVRTREAWWILDYKTGLTGDGDTVHPTIAAQLAGYAAALKPHAGAAPIYAAVITREGRVIEVPISRANG